MKYDTNWFHDFKRKMHLLYSLYIQIY